MKKTTLITLLLLLLFVQSKAQTVTGRIVDSEKQSVVMATIALQTLDSITIGATTADADGRFVLTADSIPLPFRLIVSSIGYETVMPECASYAVGDVVLTTKTNVLGDVVIKSKRPMLNVQGDRIVADVSDIFESGMPLLKEKFYTQRQTTDVRFYRRSIFLSFTYKFRNFKEQNARSVDTSRLGY